MSRLLIVGVVISLAASSATGRAQQDPAATLHRVIPSGLRIPQSPHPCTVAITVVSLARRMQLPVGVEYPADDCSRWVSETLGDVVTLDGVTVVQLLDALVERNPEYRWAVDDGVVVARPLASWNDRQHILHRRIGVIELDDVSMGGAMGAILSRLLDEPTRGAGLSQHEFRTSIANRRFSMQVENATLLDAMNGAVRAHGSIYWEAHPLTRAVAGLKDPSLGFWTFEGDGFTATTKKYR
jgi:hypothetical protein